MMIMAENNKRFAVDSSVATVLLKFVFFLPKIPSATLIGAAPARPPTPITT